MRAKLFILFVFISLSSFAFDLENRDSSQSTKLTFKSEFMSQHLWRGYAMCDVPSIEPSIEITHRFLTAGVWSALSANGEYFVEGKEVIGVSLTVQNDIITDVSVTPQARDKTSKGYQLMFVDNFKSQVIGKKIADLKLGKVSGASLTTQGFNNAVSIIKSQAAL